MAQSAIIPRQTRKYLPSPRTFVLWMIGLSAVIIVVGYALGHVSRLATVLVFLPAYAAGVGTVRQTAVAAVWVTLLVSGSFVGPRGDETNTVTAFLITGGLGALAVATAAERVRRETELTRVRTAAVALQHQILRPLPLRTDQVLVCGLYAPLEEDKLVGGDIYEAVSSPYGTRLLIGDVQGKGLPAIGAGFAVLGAFREAAQREPTLSAVVDAMESAVVRHNEFATATGEPERFVTALVLSVDSGAAAQAVNCGHGEPYLMMRDRCGPVPLDEAGVPLGLDSLSPVPRTVQWLAFPDDASLVLCTDGITEARNPDGAFYPLGERLDGWRGLRPDRLAETLRADVLRYTEGEQRDDIAVLVVRRLQSITS
ncbi:PP2C family protein-serine/threonine phosphatase [Streptomyces sp. NPDC048639]|uniref:PP2C family protein-serine/threonine phosphatase n=1 Tax=Streptomyces sp. NPDC048639 TaxID=3365581 RepID=UPI00371C1F8D